MLREDDVLLVQSGHIGHSSVVPEEHIGHNCHAMIVITTIKQNIIGSFLSLLFSSPSMQRAFQSIRSGSTVPHLTCREVKELKIIVPSLDFQRNIIEHSSKIRLEIAALEENYKSKLKYLANLKQIIIKKTLSGELKMQFAEIAQEAAE